MLVVLVFAVVMAGAYSWLVHRPLYEQLRGLDETEVRLLFRTEPLSPREGQIGGLGLFSFRERVRQIGGSLGIESNPDRGCLVTVVIPLKAGSEVRREEIESR